FAQGRGGAGERHLESAVVGRKRCIRQTLLRAAHGDRARRGRRQKGFDVRGTLRFGDRLQTGRGRRARNRGGSGRNGQRFESAVGQTERCALLRRRSQVY